MNKKEFISRVTEALRENDLRKPVSVRKHTFHITDDEGNTADFNIRQQEKSVLYTTEDTANIIDACLAVILDAIRKGEEVNIKGFGCLGLHYRAARRTKEPNSGEWCEIEAGMSPSLHTATTLDWLQSYTRSLLANSRRNYPNRMVTYNGGH